MSSTQVAWAAVALGALGGGKGLTSRAERLGFQPVDLLPQTTSCVQIRHPWFSLCPTCSQLAVQIWSARAVRAFLRRPDS